jgi:signal transduction histidine kinase
VALQASCGARGADCKIKNVMKKEKKIKQILTFEEAQERLQNIVSERNYDIKPTEFHEIVGKFIIQEKLNQLRDFLKIYRNQALDTFWHTVLSLELARVFEIYLSNTTEAKDIAYKILATDSPNRENAFRLLLNISRKHNNYDEIDMLIVKYKNLFSSQSFDVLYELVFYYAYKNDFEKVENLILKIIKKYEKNSIIIQSTRILVLKLGLSKRFESYFENTNHKKDRKYSDVKEEREREESNMMLSESERASSAVSLMDLTNGIAHEYGQPATNIRFNIQYHLNKIAKTEGVLDRKMVEECLNDILKQTERIAELNKRLAPATSSQNTMEKFNFTELLEEVMNQERIRIQENFIVLKYKKEDLWIDFDKGQLRQILSNLIINSIDSIIEKQNTAIEFKPIIKINSQNHGNSLKIYFIDNGIGIDKKIQTRIFNPFYTTKDPDKGQGLGLFMIKNILQKHKGMIWVDTEYKNGAKFTIEIPQK